MTERRRESNVKSVVIPLITAIITGVASSFIATKVTLAIIETKVEYIEVDILSMKKLLHDVNEQQVTLAERGQWMIATERRLDQIEITDQLLMEQLQDRYTRADAERDMQILRGEIKRM